MKYIIPKEVTVGTRVYKVKKVRTFGKLCLRGKVRYVLGEILIANYGYADGKYTPKEQFDTYWHELTHAILFEMEHPLFKDEAFVSAFANTLTHSINTAQL